MPSVAQFIDFFVIIQIVCEESVMQNLTQWGKCYQNSQNTPHPSPLSPDHSRLPHPSNWNLSWCGELVCGDYSYIPKDTVSFLLFILSADVGGMLGLCLGASVLTLMEFAEFGVSASSGIYKRKILQSKVVPKTQVFVKVCLAQLKCFQ